MKNILRAAGAAAALCSVASAAQATGTSPATVTPHQLTDATYTQNFNSLASTGGQVDRPLPAG